MGHIKPKAAISLFNTFELNNRLKNRVFLLKYSKISALFDCMVAVCDLAVKAVVSLQAPRRAES